MYNIEQYAIFITEKLNDELKKQGIFGTIDLYFLSQDEISLFYENNVSRYFFFFLWKKDKTQGPYKGTYPCLFDPECIVKEIKEKVPKINTSYIV